MIYYCDELHLNSKVAKNRKVFMNHYMMATKAEHKIGDISSNKPDLCIIDREEGDYYIGSWSTGYGFIDVKFPKATTRHLTNEERKRFHID